MSNLATINLTDAQALRKPVARAFVLKVLAWAASSRSGVSVLQARFIGGKLLVRAWSLPQLPLGRCRLCNRGQQPCADEPPKVTLS